MRGLQFFFFFDEALKMRIRVKCASRFFFSTINNWQFIIQNRGHDVIVEANYFKL